MKLIASDFDGTLYRNRIITDRDRSAIAEWQARGNLFGIVTGRGAGIIETAAEHGITLDYAITENGAVVLDRDGNILYEDWFYRGIAKEYYDFAYSTDFGFQDKNVPDADPADMQKEHQLALLLEDEVQAAALAAQLNAHFDGRLVSYSNGWWINTVKYGTSKATGIAHYAEIMGIARKDIYTVGDYFNDLPMLTAFDGYVVATCHPDMRQHVRHVCDDIAHLIELAGKD